MPADLAKAELYLAAQLIRQRYLALEASAVALPHGGVVFAGTSGTGKSSLALCFSRQGLPLVADGVVGIDLRVEGTTSVLPALGPVEISEDVLAALSMEPELAPRVRDGVPRFLASGVTFVAEPVPLAAVFLLGRKGDGQPNIVPVMGRSRVLAVVALSFNRFLCDVPEVRHRMLFDAAWVLQGTPVFRLQLPERPLQLDLAAALVREACGFG